MSEKYEFKRDVGQAVIGNVNEAQRLNNSNYVNVNLNSLKTEDEKISSRQKALIYGKVKELMAARQQPDSNDHRLEIYGAILDQFHISRIDDLLSKHHKGVIAMMSRWIKEATDQPSVSPQAADQVIAAPALTVRSEPATASAKPFYGSANIDSGESLSISRLQRIVKIQTLALVACASICCILLYKIAFQPPAIAPTAQHDDRCYIAGKPYSIGYIDRTKGRIPLQCVGPIGDMPSMWLDANRGQ